MGKAQQKRRDDRGAAGRGRREAMHLLAGMRRAGETDEAAMRRELATLHGYELTDSSWAAILASVDRMRENDPDVHNAGEARAHLEAVRVAAAAHDWSAHPAADRDRSVLGVIIGRGEQLGRVRYGIGVREIAAACEPPITPNAAARAIRSLAREGWLAWMSPERPHLWTGNGLVFATNEVKLYRSRLYDGCAWRSIRVADTGSEGDLVPGGTRPRYKADTRPSPTNQYLPSSTVGVCEDLSAAPAGGLAAVAGEGVQLTVALAASKGRVARCADCGGVLIQRAAEDGGGLTCRYCRRGWSGRAI